MKEKQVQVQVEVEVEVTFLNNKPKMAQFSKLKLLFVLKLNKNGSQFRREISKFSYIFQYFAKDITDSQK